MATTSRANPIPSEQVTIDVDSVAYGYPVDPQPLPSATTVDPEYSKECKEKCFVVIFSFVLWLTFTCVAFSLHSSKKLPRFQLDSVSLNVVNTTTAAWDIVFSIDKTVGDLDVWVRFMARDYKIETVGTAGNATVSVGALLPQAGFDFSGGRLTLEQVTFRCSNYEKYLLEAACKDVDVVGFSSKNETSTRGVMQGGPRVCPVVNHKHI